MSSKPSFSLTPVTVLATAAAVLIGALAYRHFRRAHGHGHSHGDAHGHAHGSAHGHGGSGGSGDGSDVSAREAAGDARFSAIAEKYDSNPSLQVVNARVVAALSTKLPFALDPERTDVLEFGCGTGAVTMAIAPRVRSVVALDAAEGMIAAVRRKVAAAGAVARNVTPVLRRIERVEDLPPAPGASSSAERFDVIFTTLALHHVPRPDATLRLFKQMLKPGGVVLITDLIHDARTVAMMQSAATHPDAAGHHAHGHGHGGGDAHGHSHGSDGGGHGHSHGGGGGHGHSHGGGGGGGGDGGGDAKADGTPTDVFHTGFSPEQFRRLPGHCGLKLLSLDAPYFSVQIFGVEVDLFAAVAQKELAPAAAAAATAAAAAAATAAATAAGDQKDVKKDVQKDVQKDA